MRGTPDAHELTTCVGGIIPAYAGNTTNFVACQNRSRDHPRICGEHDGAERTLSTSTGSSPHMRGTHMRQRRRGLLVGIIPAYAGNTGIWSDIVRFRRDHPRICGEHSCRHLAHRLPQGSSPHMRGTPDFYVDNVRGYGIIPAYAGNTNAPSSTHVTARDHPRICGEHTAIKGGRMMAGGSSPHMRGTLEKHPRGTVSARDHPRICGEHPYRIIPIPEDMGSSPHMRGTPSRYASHWRSVGIIPAYAGNTRAVSSVSCSSKDHPRICGEHPVP